MNSLREALIEYLNARRASGIKLRAAGYGLSRFVSFMEERGASCITTELAVEWVKQASHAKSLEPARAQYLGFIREFARYCLETDPRTEIPPYGLLSHPKRCVQSCSSRKNGSGRSGSSQLNESKSSNSQSLRKAAVEYLSTRRTLGYKLRFAGAGLMNFVSFAEQMGADYVTVRLALEWAQKPPSAHPATWAQRLGFVREFARHRIATDPRTEIPAWDLLPHSAKRAQPHLYSDEEIRHLLIAALNLPVSNHQGILRRQTYYCLFGLLAVSGMRVSEAVGLKLQDVDLDAGVLAIHGSKFGQSRLVPVHPSTQKALSDFRNFRDRYLNEHGFTSEYFFTTYGGGCLDTADVRRNFYAMSHMTGLRAKGSSKGPRIHDLRHRYAVETLLRWYRDGEDVERKLPHLSTYLGHVKVKDTYWYLTACPELMGLAVRLFEQRWEEN